VPESIVADAESRLRAASLRVTAARIAVLEALALDTGHPTVDTIHRAARERSGAVTLQGVYAILGDLEEVGLVRRIQPAGSPARYEARVGDNHHHLVCRRCGVSVDVACVTGSAPCLEPDEDHGFTIDEAEVLLWGVCPACRSAANDPRAHSPSNRAHDDHSRIGVRT